MRTWWLELAQHALRHWSHLTLLLLLMLLSVGLDVIRPWPLKLLVDYPLAGQPLPTALGWTTSLPGAGSAAGLVFWLAASTVLLFLGSHVARMAQTQLRVGVGSRMAYDLGARLFDHLQALSLRFHARQPRGDLVRRVTTDSTCLRELVMGVLLPTVSSLISLGAMFVVMLRLDPSLALLALVVAPAQVILMKAFDRPMTQRTRRHQDVEGKMMSHAEQTLAAIPVVQAFGREPTEERRFRTLCDGGLKAYVGAMLAQLRFKLCVNATTAIGTAVVMGVGGWHVVLGRLTVGGLLVFMAYLAALYAPLEDLAYVSVSLASAKAKASRVLEILAADDAVRDAPGSAPLPRHAAGATGHIALEHVTFGYEPGRPVLRDVSLEAGPGEVVALVGHSGAGKTTVALLIHRLFDPWEGRINIDGSDLRNVQLASLRSSIALVLQDPFLLPTTVAENIAYGRPDAEPEEIRKAAAAANADQFIEALPEGYDTVIGERGATLSGGERQRLAIARALLKDAPVLILDEPTSALDAETEAQVMEALERLMKGRTTLVIAHRLSTVQRADKVMVLEEGRVVEQGTHDGLIGSDGPYRRLCEAQMVSSGTPADADRYGHPGAGETAPATRPAVPLAVAERTEGAKP